MRRRKVDEDLPRRSVGRPMRPSQVKAGRRAVSNGRRPAPRGRKNERRPALESVPSKLGIRSQRRKGEHDRSVAMSNPRAPWSWRPAAARPARVGS